MRSVLARGHDSPDLGFSIKEQQIREDFLYLGEREKDD